MIYKLLFVDLKTQSATLSTKPTDLETWLDTILND